MTTIGLEHRIVPYPCVCASGRQGGLAGERSGRTGGMPAGHGYKGMSHRDHMHAVRDRSQSSRWEELTCNVPTASNSRDIGPPQVSQVVAGQSGTCWAHLIMSGLTRHTSLVAHPPHTYIIRSEGVT